MKITNFKPLFNLVSESDQKTHLPVGFIYRTDDWKRSQRLKFLQGEHFPLNQPGFILDAEPEAIAIAKILRETDEELIVSAGSGASGMKLY